VFPELWHTARAAEGWLRNNPLDPSTSIIRLWGVFVDYKPKRQRRWSRVLVRHGAGARVDEAPSLGDLGPFGDHGFLHRRARQHSFAVLHDARQLGRVDPPPSIQVPIVNRYGSQIVYCSPMTHGPFSSLRSISSKHSVMVARTLRFIASIAARDALCRHAAPRFAGHRRFFEPRRKWVWIRTRGRPPSLSHNRATMLGR
jgi:hypothetical protein